MTALHALWLASWVFSAVSLASMGLLILGRLLRERRHARRRRTHDAVVDAYLRIMRDGAEARAALEPYRGQGRILAEALLELLDIVRGGQRDRLVEGLQAFGLDAVLRQRAQRGAPPVRLAALEALACFPGPQTEAVVRSVGRRLGGEARMAALRSLSALGAHIDLDSVITDMVRRQEPWSGSLADVLKLLAERQPDDCARLLGRTDLPDALRAMIAEALSAAGDYTLLPLLSEAAASESALVRAASLRALGRLVHPAAQPAVARGLDDSDWQVRGAAVAAAGAGGFANLIPQLSARLADPVWWVRFQAAEALARLGPQGAGALRAIVQSGSDLAARAASLTLAERGLR